MNKKNNLFLLLFLIRYCILEVDFAGKRRAKASQMSTLWPMVNRYKASKAIDGNCWDYRHRGFTHTNDEWYPWWQVDLGAYIDVRNVTVITRRKYNNKIIIADLFANKKYY